MGARKKISAEKRKEALKTMYFAKLQNVPTSPRKMRLVADMIRGMEVNRALGVLKFSSKEAAARVEKLLRSAIAKWKTNRKGGSLMGQKVNPISNRLGIIRGWDSNWYGGNDYGDSLLEDSKIRKYLNARLAKASVSRIVIERTLKLVTITV